MRVPPPRSAVLTAVRTAVLSAVLAVVLAASLLGAAPASGVAVPEPTVVRPMPSKQRWEADVRAVMDGSTTHLHSRARRARAHGFPVRRLAVNLDIDNTSLASYYDHGRPVAPTLRYARTAHRLGMRVFFNSARPRSKARVTLRALRAAGYPVDRLCLARRDEGTVNSKRRCRARFRADGFRLVGNVGNRRTDFVGGGYERAYKLPDYGGRLG